MAEPSTANAREGGCMDIPVVLSHRTAWLFYHAPHRLDAMRSGTGYGISAFGIPAREVGRRICRFLLDCGVPQDELDSLDILVAMDFVRTNAQTTIFKPHVFGALVTAHDVHEVVPGLCVVRESLCFMQASGWMSDLEQIQYGYELCGRYETALGRDGYVERAPVLSCKEVRLYLDAHKGLRGAKRAKSALTRVRDRSRSPMETATALMIVLPRKMGGLGYRGITLNEPLVVLEASRQFTRSTELEVDILAVRKRVGVEYDGDDHASAMQRARDAERMTTLASMGLRMHVITKVQFAEQLLLHRSLNAIARDLGVPIDTSRAFQLAQNELRSELIKDWK